MKPWFNYLVYISLACLAFALYRAEYLTVPHVYSGSAIAGSFVFLFAGFIADALSWRHLIRRSSYNVTRRECFAAVGLSTFGKYVPGKIWTIVGRAAYVAERHAAPLAVMSSISLTWQFVMLWLGLLFGAAGLFLVRGMDIWGLPVLFLWLGLTVLSFTNIAQHSTKHLMKRLLKRDFVIPDLSVPRTLASLPWFAVTLVLLSAGFYLLVLGLVSTDVPLSVGLGFPLSIVLGTMAVLIPGGVGVREGLMVGYLKLAGIPLPDAVTISVAARLWYLVGETFMFVVGVAANKKPADKRPR